MIKISNAKEICVFETSVEKLIQRDYAYLYVYLFDLCRENTGHSMDLKCHIVHHPQFLKRGGLPNTIDYETTSADESSPPIYYGHGYFNSDDTEYEFTFVYKDTRYLKKFNINERNKLE